MGIGGHGFTREQVQETESLSLGMVTGIQRSGTCSASHHQMSWAGSHQDRAPRWKHARGVIQETSPISQSWAVKKALYFITFKDNTEEDTRAREPNPLTWGDDQEPRMEEEYLECPPALDPQVQEFLTGEVPETGNGLEDTPTTDYRSLSPPLRDTDSNC